VINRRTFKIETTARFLNLQICLGYIDAVKTDPPGDYLFGELELKVWRRCKTHCGFAPWLAVSDRQEPRPQNVV
jgi:hypothetical protein